ncbi:hypothetical protein SBA5_160054 [Candidatus Sulfotelmatomonas gaucii]|uniref:Uncharacterized protein n=1 Tax=Candidatus Sulfuritelmatomonas gaucii TaxID=2043161 RepID=A0A2N9L5N6_9BACT|nr:hypothetical protein SBA5_160054 [Candidatus Sulfotelmatomonas gaucii]
MSTHDAMVIRQSRQRVLKLPFSFCVRLYMAFWGEILYDPSHDLIFRPVTRITIACSPQSRGSHRVPHPRRVFVFAARLGFHRPQS